MSSQQAAAAQKASPLPGDVLPRTLLTAVPRHVPLGFRWYSSWVCAQPGPVSSGRRWMCVLLSQAKLAAPPGGHCHSIPSPSCIYFSSGTKGVPINFRQCRCHGPVSPEASWDTACDAFQSRPRKWLREPVTTPGALWAYKSSVVEDVLLLWLQMGHAKPSQSLSGAHSPAPPPALT